MKNRCFLTVHRLMHTNCALLNRGSFGEQKTIQDDQGCLEARLSKASLLRPIRLSMGLDGGVRSDKKSDIRSSHLADCVDKIMDAYIEDGRITKEQKEDYGKIISEFFDSDWSKRGDNKGEKGRTVTVTNVAELETVVRAILDFGASEEGQKCSGKKFAEAATKAASEALRKIKLSINEALFGRMVASPMAGYGTIDGAVYMSNAYSVNEYIPSEEFITASFEAPDPFYGDTSDPFRTGLNAFIEEESKKARAQTIAGSQMSTNTFYNVAQVNVSELKNNLDRNVLMEKVDDTPLDLLQDTVTDFVENFALTMPSGKQHSNLSMPSPTIVYIECSADGIVPRTMESHFSKVIKDVDDVQEEAIKRMLKGVKESVNINKIYEGDITRYVYLSCDYEHLEKDFADLGVKVLKDFGELEEILNAEVERMYA